MRKGYTWDRIRTYIHTAANEVLTAFKKKAMLHIYIHLRRKCVIRYTMETRHSTLCRYIHIATIIICQEKHPISIFIKTILDLDLLLSPRTNFVPEVHARQLPSNYYIIINVIMFFQQLYIYTIHIAKDDIFFRGKIVLKIIYDEFSIM